MVTVTSRSTCSEFRKKGVPEMGDGRDFDEDDADRLAAVVAVGVEIADRDDKESDEGLSDL